MFAQRVLPLLLVAALACSDTPTSFGPWPDIDEDGRPLESIPGYVVAHDLLRSGDTLIRMYGYATLHLRELIGAEILAEGRTDAEDGAFFLRDLTVLSIDGLPVFDGELRLDEEGYRVVTRQAEEWIFAELPEELADNVGRRVWVAVHDGQCVRYGVIDM